MIQPFFLAGLALGIIGVSFSEAAPPLARPKVLKVEGAKSALLQKGVELREGGPGTEIEPGEHVRTDQSTTVTVSYSDGSTLTVHPGTDVAIGEVSGGMQLNHLRSGRVQGEVKKAEGGTESGPRKPLKFFIRTKTAVMGVRGTEFLASADAASGLSQFHTLEGTVEVATSPSSLVAGQGVPLGAGKMVLATDTGLSEVRSFNRMDLLKSLDASSVSGAGLSGETRPAKGGAVKAPNALAPEAALAQPSAQNAPPPPAPRVADKTPEAAAATEQKKAEAEREKPTFHLLAASLGAFLSRDPSGGGRSNYYRAVSFAWTPVIPIPLPILQLYARGSFGGMVFQNGSLNNNFLVREYLAFAGTSFLRPLFFELGAGKQVWVREKFDAGMVAANAGFILSENGRLNRVFIGVSHFFGGDSHPNQIRAGLGIQY